MRLKLKAPPTKPLFTTHSSIGVSDLNYGNHLGNDKVLTIAHETRLRFLHHLDYDELNFFGAALIMASAQVQYLGQGYFGDKLTMNLWITESSNTGFHFFTQILGEEREIARVDASLIFFNYQTQRPIHSPDSFQRYLKENDI